MSLQQIVRDKRVLEQWLATLIQRGDVCSEYKKNCVLDVIHLLTMESQQSTMEQQQ
jgi:hypothetical protein